MADSGGGWAINISSTEALQFGPGLWVYSTSEARVIQFIKCAAVDLGEYAVRVGRSIGCTRTTGYEVRVSEI
jgi:NAD(P)-dependent dehydrogenase (short-subunit alcohol dehydrogenase family)